MKMNEFSKPVQCMKIYSEIKQILVDLGLMMEKNDNWESIWTMQRGWEETMLRKKTIREDEYMQKEGRIVVTNVTLDLQNYKIPHRML